MLQGWLEHLLLKYTKGQHAILLWDDCSAHLTEDVRSFCEANNIHVVLVPRGCTSFGQPLDIGVNATFKANYRKLWKNWIKGVVRGRGVGGKILPPTREQVLEWVFVCNNMVSETAITRSFAKAGIQPRSG